MTANTILLVEDNPSDEILTLRAFKQNHIVNDVVVARDGEEALNYLFAKGSYQGRDSSQMPLMVILDLNLPKIAGLEVLQKLRHNDATANLPVVVLTSSSEERDIASAYDNGSNAYVQKPIDFVEFNDAVKHLAEFWLRLNKPYPAKLSA